MSNVQVLKYIPVMARPLVLLREQHPVRWTGVYADIEVHLTVASSPPPATKGGFHGIKGFRIGFSFSVFLLSIFVILKEINHFSVNKGEGKIQEALSPLKIHINKSYLDRKKEVLIAKIAKRCILCTRLWKKSFLYFFVECAIFFFETFFKSFS